MGTDVERVERYLRGVAAPSYVSERHRQQLRRRILGEIGKKRTIPVPGKVWRIAVAGVILVCLGGVVGTFLDVRYRTVDRQADGVGQLVSEDVQNEYILSASIPDANGIVNAVQTAKEPEKADLPAEQDDIEVVMVGANDPSPAQIIEVEVSGRPGAPLQYAVAKSRRNVVGANNHSPVPTGNHSSLPTNLSPADWGELSQLRQAGKGEDLGTQERQLKGRTFVFKRERYTLRNKTRVIVSVGTPKEAR